MGRSHPAPVGSFELDCSPFGVMDMGGGVTEWTSSMDPGKGAGVMKGASFNAPAMYAEIALDRFARPYEAYVHFGARLCFDLVHG